MAPFEPDADKAREHGLTEREREVLCLVCVGLVSKEIGARLGIEPETARVHLAGVRRKLDAQTTSEAPPAPWRSASSAQPPRLTLQIAPPVKREVKPNVCWFTDRGRRNRDCVRRHRRVDCRTE
jgi:DNA-binding CsgD family transcriptional regulator